MTNIHRFMTFNINGVYGDDMFWRVDWILARGGNHPLQMVASAIVRDEAPPTYPSDHYPVINEIAFLK